MKKGQGDWDQCDNCSWSCLQGETLDGFGLMLLFFIEVKTQTNTLDSQSSNNKPQNVQ